ncbi:MAG: pectate lyase, partial [Clostridia bacterium]|nr:pectate lyase [Clostridia bacterium]
SSGAYNDDGTLKANAKVIYVTENTKDTVTLSVSTGKIEETFTGVQNIITGYKKETAPLAIRFIGNVGDPADMPKGDLYLDALTAGVTVEGIGDDATANGWGIVIKNTSNLEVRNLGFMNCDSTEGDDVGLQQANDHIWVHNCDFFYGDAGSDADQVKGDGALDTKKSSYVTHSYNHFWDNGKCNLQGMKDETTDNKITYHHNWYDHSDSRHPRIRTCTVHIYNNYFDGNAKYCVGVTMGASAFVENNYFRSTAKMKPMLASGQGTDAKGEGTFSGENGGIIKAYGNTFVGSYDLMTQKNTADKTDIDCYLADARDEVVPSDYTTKKGGTTYNNFDTASDFYSYEVDSPEVAKEKIEKYAGRINGGDLKWTFDNAKEDANYAVIPGLKAKLTAYKNTEILKVAGVTVTGVASGSNATTGGDNGDGDGETTGGNNSSVTGFIPADCTRIDFAQGASYPEGISIAGNYDDKTGYLKMEGSTKITLRFNSAGTLTIHGSEGGKKIKVNDTNYTLDSSGNVQVPIVLTNGEATIVITKNNPTSLVYLLIS